MNIDEIKEILHRFNIVKKAPNKLSYYPEDLLSREDMWLLLDYITNLQEENRILKENAIHNYKVVDKAIEYITSYESINTIEECDIPENNEWLDEDTFIEMVRRYMIIHDKLLNILKGEKNE